MDKIFSAIKCVNCRNLLNTPVCLPCGHSICQIHVNQNKSIYCNKCGLEHQIPEKGGFPVVEALASIIESKIASLDFGNNHKDAKESCTKLADLINRIDAILNDPCHFTFEEINDLKNEVHIKGELLKVKIDEEMNALLDKLEEYKQTCKNYLKTDQFSADSNKLDQDSKSAKFELNKCLSILDEVKVNEEEWKRIKLENEERLNDLDAKLQQFKFELLLNRLEAVKFEVDHFKNIDIDSVLNIK